VRVTVDETWVSFVSVATKDQSKQWTHTHSPNKPEILNKRCLSVRTRMATVFWDRKGVLMVELMQQGTTVTWEVCCETLKKLRRAFQNKMLEMLTSGIVLLLHNSRPHTVARTRALLEHFNWGLYDYPFYSPDLSPSDYRLFTYAKNWTRSQLFSNNEELMEGVKTWLSS
jgi:transposase